MVLRQDVAGKAVDAVAPLPNATQVSADFSVNGRRLAATDHDVMLLQRDVSTFVLFVANAAAEGARPRCNRR